LIGDRIREFLERKGLKLEQLAEIAGISQGALSDIKNNKRDPRGDTIAKLVRNTDINAHWLLTGEGPMIRTGGGSGILSNGIIGSPVQAVYIDDPKIRQLVLDLTKILKSDDTVMKIAITNNIEAFSESVDRKVKLDQSVSDSDFKTQGTPGASEHPENKHHAGGK